MVFFHWFGGVFSHFSFSMISPTTEVLVLGVLNLPCAFFNFGQADRWIFFRRIGNWRGSLRGLSIINEYSNLHMWYCTPPQKNNMTGWKSTMHEECQCSVLFKMEIFQCHVSFQDIYIFLGAVGWIYPQYCNVTGTRESPPKPSCFPFQIVEGWFGVLYRR